MMAAARPARPPAGARRRREEASIARGASSASGWTVLRCYAHTCTQAPVSLTPYSAQKLGGELQCTVHRRLPAVPVADTSAALH